MMKLVSKFFGVSPEGAGSDCAGCLLTGVTCQSVPDCGGTSWGKGKYNAQFDCTSGALCYISNFIKCGC
ncbi:hypothetical protein EV586_10296 [Tumebacillus sp. BK434]|nr:hypothetical protein EV586_10296 [Tumebacillus sp. BK434]